MCAEVVLSTVAPEGLVVESTATVPEPFTDPLGVKKQKIISAFGQRTIPLELRAPVATTAQLTLIPGDESHEGIDLSAPLGSLVRASRSGKVIFAGFSKMYVSRKNKNDQHRLVIIRHPDGMSSRYVHLAGLRVRPGQDVATGQAIGSLSASDEWTAPVLHFEIRDIQGQALDPAEVLAPPDLVLGELKP